LHYAVEHFVRRNEKGARTGGSGAPGLQPEESQAL